MAKSVPRAVASLEIKYFILLVKLNHCSVKQFPKLKQAENIGVLKLLHPSPVRLSCITQQRTVRVNGDVAQAERERCYYDSLTF
jgi:hypothetical protein